MASIFVSYSRKDIVFTRHLVEQLQKHEMDVWVDLEDIPPTVDWMNEIQKGIEEADNFLFIISPDSITSKVCRDELELAVKNGKRLLPVVAHEIKWDDAPAALSKLNYIFFRETDDFDAAFDTLLTAIDTDYEWVQTHRILQVKALEWEHSGKDRGFLLHGIELDEAEQEISINANMDPHPTDLQREYVLLSRQEATRQRRITTSILIALMAVMMGIIGLLVRPYVEDAIAKAQARNLSMMIPVPAGSIDFQLGDTFETITLSEFSIEIQPVTDKVYDLCVKVNKCTPSIGSSSIIGGQKPDDPVVWITIVQAVNYCEWLGRRLPSAPQWEIAAHLFAQPSSLNTDNFTIWEWTSSYQEINSQVLSGDWNGKLDTLIIDWIFLQEARKFSTPESPVIYTNISGAFGANANLGFRCVNK